MLKLYRCLALLMILPLALGGCSPLIGVESRAYALALALDVEKDGNLVLTVSIPRISKPSGDEAEGGGASPYLHFSATGEDWPEALAALRLSIPRALNLSHIVLLAVSEALAASPRFSALINRLAETRNLYTATRVVVCPGSAGDFVRGEEPLIGTRLSSEIEGATAHYAALGAIPDTCLSDLYCASNGLYGDIAVARGQTRKGQDEAKPAASLLSPGPAAIGNISADCGYAGCALFSAGRMKLSLDARDTLCLNLACGGLQALRANVAGRSVELTLSGPVSRRMDVRGGAAALSVALSLRTQEPLTAEEAQAIERAAAEGITRVVHICQREALDPFRFAEAACRQFLTLKAWRAFDWRAAYAAAPLTVRVRVRAG